MMKHRLILYFLAACIFAMAAPLRAEVPVTDKIDFNRDVRPILSENCFFCHGFDKNSRKADLRLDEQAGLFGKLKDGATIVVPGKPDDSALLRKITSADPDDRMPPADSNKSLSARDIEVLKRWIEQGAAWEGHWAYLPPKQIEPPSVEDPNFVRNSIDKFVLEKLKKTGLSPSPQADRATLLRRLSFDLTGLPATQDEVEAFIKDTSADAYEKQVDRLLASPHFGERMAMYWLDLVRYADTIGYHSDNPHNVYPYREYVVSAFNRNKPFDVFTIEQLAGDLMPRAGVEQKIASTYNRLLQTTEEGGAQPREYIAKYQADRVRNFSSVWLGQTMGCAECHDHKFDPLSTKDFYSLAAFFADIQEKPVGGRGRGELVPTPEQAAKLKSLNGAVSAAEEKLKVAGAEAKKGQPAWERHVREQDAGWHVLEPQSWTVKGDSLLKKLDGGILMSDMLSEPAEHETYTIVFRTDLKNITGIRLDTLTDPKMRGKGAGRGDGGNFILTELRVSATPANQPEGKGKPRTREGRWKNARATFEQDDFPVWASIDGYFLSGWAVAPQLQRSHAAVYDLEKPIGFEGGTILTVTMEFHGTFPQHVLGKFRLSATTESTVPAPVYPDIREALAIAPDQRTPQQQSVIDAYYLDDAPELKPLRDAVATEMRKRSEFRDTIPTSLVTRAGKPRTVRILPRGNWLDESGEIVQPAVPAVLPQIQSAEGVRPTRLDLAKWVVSPENPLAGRVFVNRLWKLFYGQGISKTLEDFGAQGEWPTHPELLDWLATDFRDHNWDIKRMVRQLVTSGTYQQSSIPTAEMVEHDPFNRLYARQSRFRLDAEMVRDNALALSGLLKHKSGGTSVFPYQPAGYWAALNFPEREWENSKGDDLYRRGLYTHWQRSFLHPSLLAFDAPSREEAVCERAKSNIPQQALTLLNDPTYVEASRVFAERAIKEGGKTTEDRIHWAFKTALSRPASDKELAVLAELLTKHLEDYRNDVKSAEKVLSIGAAPRDKAIDPAELASWMSVTRTILNLHETITRS